MNSIDSGTTIDLLAAIERGDSRAVNQLLAFIGNYLKRVVEVRLDPNCAAGSTRRTSFKRRSWLPTRRIQDFLKRRPTSFRIWLRRKAFEQLIDQRRHHRAKARCRE